MTTAGEGIRLRAGDDTYLWNEQWAALPTDEFSRRGWAHTEVVVTSDGQVVTGDAGEPKVLVFEPDGSLARSFPVPVTEVHGITLVPDQGGEVLWISDIGRKRRPERNYETELAPDGGQVIAVDMSGKVVARLPTPDHGAYAGGVFAPTMLDVDHDSGDVWVTDGYGQSLVHKYDRSGTHVGSLSGEEQDAAGRFNCPHCVYIDRRKPVPEVYIADRGNHRIQVYDLGGAFKRAFGSEFMTSPTDLLVAGDLMLIVELIDAGLTIFDRDDQLVARLGTNPGSHDSDGWPNSKLADGTIVRNDHLVPGKFTSPHSVALDREGSLYVTEYLIGGRVTKLQRI